MNNRDVLLFLAELEVKNVAVMKDYGYDDPADVLTVDIYHTMVHLEHSKGYMCFTCDSIDFDAKHQKLSFFYEDEPHVEMNIANIDNIRSS